MVLFGFPFHHKNCENLTRNFLSRTAKNISSMSSSCQFFSLPTLDSDEIAKRNKSILCDLVVSASSLGRDAVHISTSSLSYTTPSGKTVDLQEQIQVAVSKKVSISPTTVLPSTTPLFFPACAIQVRNQTSLEAAQSLIRENNTPLILNFANGTEVG